MNDLTHLGNAYGFSFQSIQNENVSECGPGGLPGAKQTLYELLIPAPTNILEIFQYKQWCAGDCLTTSSLGEKEINSWFLAFPNSSGVKTSTVADFKIPTGYH